MKEFFTLLWSNKVLMAALAGWIIAQIFKVITYTVIYREWRWDRMWGSGGMPSCHAAMVLAMVVAALLNYGIASPYFAISFIVMIVVLHDAMNVRLETGKQAKMITAITDFIEKSTNSDVFPDVELKELVGHTPLQVLAGSAIGIIVGLFFK